MELLKVGIITQVRVPALRMFWMMLPGSEPMYVRR